MIPRNLDPFWLSLQIASLATALVAVIGTPIAWVLARVRFVGRDLLGACFMLPLVLPPTVIGYGLLLCFGRRGWVGRWLDQTIGISVVFHWSGAVLAAAVMATPMFIIPVRDAFAGVNPDLETAAQLLGRSESSVFWSITVPLSWRGYVSGLVLTFARALGEFGATLMLAGNIPGRTQTASLAIYDAVLADDTFLAGGYSLLIMVTSLVAVLGAQQTRRVTGA